MGLKDKLLYFDQFGALFSLSIQGEDPTFKSMSGAIASLLINITSFGYFCYLISIWLNDQVIPTVASSNIFQQDGKTFQLSESPFYFTMESYDNITLKQFKGRRLYDVRTQFFYDSEVYQEQNYKVKCNPKFSVYIMDFFDPICANVTDQHQQKLTQNYKERLLDDYLGYQLYPCNFENDSTCFNETEAENFLLNLNGDGRITTITYEYDLAAQQIKHVPFDYYFPVGFKLKTVINLQITVTHLTIERGVIFPTRESIEFVSKIEFKPQTALRETNEPYIKIEISLDRKQINMDVVYPKLPEILAQFQFVFSWLMMFGIIFTSLNNKSLNKKLLQQIGTMYFNNYLILDKPRREYETQESFEKMQKIKAKINGNLTSKFNFINLMFEVSRLQFAIQTLISKEQLKQLAEKKYVIKYEDNQEDTNEQLIQDDFYCFSYCHKKQLKRLQRPILKKKGNITKVFDSNFDCVNQNNNQQAYQLDSGKQNTLECAEKYVSAQQSQASPLKIENIT